jgi:hypothetical protein
MMKQNSDLRRSLEGQTTALQAQNETNLCATRLKALGSRSPQPGDGVQPSFRRNSGRIASPAVGRARDDSSCILSCSRLRRFLNAVLADSGLGVKSRKSVHSGKSRDFTRAEANVRNGSRPCEKSLP